MLTDLASYLFETTQNIYCHMLFLFYRERQVSWTNLLPSLLLIILLPFIVAALCSLANDDTPESFQQIEDIFHASQNNYSVALFFPQVLHIFYNL